MSKIHINYSNMADLYERGFTQKEIAEELHCGLRTVERWIPKLINKSQKTDEDYFWEKRETDTAKGMDLLETLYAPPKYVMNEDGTYGAVGVEVNGDPYEYLASAIICTAIDDYRECKRLGFTNSQKEIEDFFKSDYCKNITPNIDMESILENILS